MGWVSSTHTARYRAHHHSVGGGHLFQGPFKSFPVADDGHFPVVCRYVERNALSPGLVGRAEGWRWGSLHRRIERPKGWTERVNEPITDRELSGLRLSVAQGRPRANPQRPAVQPSES